ncbi:MAG TPA: elongation factor P [Planctomycetota bacterium]|nr:elongation factor P [Planctomycetota bacterium]
MAVPATEAKRGNVLKLEDRYYLVVDANLVTPGNWRGFIQFKLKDMASGSVAQKRISSDAKIEVIYLDRKECEYLYRQGQTHVFMDKETYDQYEIPASDIEGVLPFLLENTVVTVTFLEGKPVSVDLPASVNLKVVEADAAARGNTATDVKKQAKVETGLIVAVPHFITAGETIKVDTRTGDFISRA